MIISKTPYRMSFFGGGTDYPQWYLQEGGAVLSTTIDKYCYITCRLLPPFFPVKHRIVWSQIETVDSISEIQHPAVREGLKFLGMDDSTGLEIHHQGDLPARSGIGSSSSFSVGLIKSLTALRGQMISKHDLALKAIELEQTVLKENVGAQDQMAAAYGGFNLIQFERSGDINVEPVTIPAERLEKLESSLMLFYTGASRTASEIAATMVTNIPSRKDELRKMTGLVDDALGILKGDGPIDDFGSLLHKGWMLKRTLSDAVSNSEIDSIYETATNNGALGGKLMGAGGTGFMVFYVPEEKRQSLRRALSGYLRVPFKFEREGSSIIYYSPNDSGSFAD